jgi:FAD dependent oxidoreductase
MNCKTILCLVFALVAFPAIHSSAETQQYDIVIYGGTSGGVAAAVQVKRMGKSVILLEPSQHLGGLTSGGLGATDIGNKGAIGGVSREFYESVREYYSHENAWKHEKSEQYLGKRNNAQDQAMWTFEPHVAELIMKNMCEKAVVPVRYGQRLDLKQGVKKEGTRIVSIRMEDGNEYAASRFIDATYEGDLMAKAGVEYTWGREANSTYGETLNGVQVRNAKSHQLNKGIDPYIKKGDSSSGLLPGIDAAGPGIEGSADKRLQAYNFRMCVTHIDSNKIAFEKPADYNELDYELLFRNFEAGETRAPWNPVMMPNRKTDANNNFGFSTDYIGMNYNWPEADYAEREKIYAQHLRYQKGLMWTLANHARVPESLRKEFSKWGNCKDEFSDNGGWSHQIYVREARRMISDYVMSQHNCQGREKLTDSVGLAAYTMDSHNTQRYVNPQGFVQNEGDVQVGGFAPYPISYRSIVPKQNECQNLFVPICLSATHIAYGSIRMEPVFMVLGQSAATAAVLSIESNTPVQKVDITKLQERLLADKQILTWDKPWGGHTGVDAAKLPGIILDDSTAKLTGEWEKTNSLPGYVNVGYLHDSNAEQGSKQVTFQTKLEQPQKMEVRMAYIPNPNRATNVKVDIHTATGVSTVIVNQKLKPEHTEGFFKSLGTFMFDKEVVIVIHNEKANGFVVVDAMQLLPIK